MAQLTPAANQQVATIQQLLVDNLPKIKSVIPIHMDSKRLARVALQTCERNPALLSCTPNSLVIAFLNSAELGVEPGLTGEAYLVPYGNTCTLIIGYKGMMKLARNTGKVKSFQVGVVREGDTFEYERGSNTFLRHIEQPDNENPITHFWASAKVEGDFLFEVMSKRQVDAIKARGAGNGPWKTDYEEMGKKTVLRRFCKMLPIATENEASQKLAKAVALDEHADANIKQVNDFVDLGAAEEVNQNDTGAGAKAKAKLGISSNDTPPGATYVPAVPDRTDKGFKAWFDGLSEEDSKAYTDAYENARNEGQTVDDSHVVGLAAINS